MGDLKAFWRNLAGILIVPVLGVAVALILLFGRVSAIEERQADTPTRAEVESMRREMGFLRDDIRELRLELNRDRR